MSFFGLGGAGIKLHIALNAPSSSSSSSSSKENSKGIVPIDHIPKWKASKNPFQSLKLLPSAVSPSSEENAKNPLSRGYSTGGVNSSNSGNPKNEYANYGMRNEEFLYAYEENEDVEGVVTLSILPGKKAEHLGMKVEFVGRIETDNMAYEGRPNYDFISLSKELEPPSTIYDHKRTYPFHFRNLEKPHETYHGKHVSVRYFVRVILQRKYLPPLTQKTEVICQRCGPPKDMISRDTAIKMEVGIEDCLHIEFEYQKRYYHLEDVISGKVHFLLVRIKIKHMELAVIRRETAGVTSDVGTIASNSHRASQPQPPSSNSPRAEEASRSSNNATTETQVLIKYEIMDGAPVKNEIIPVRLCLKGIPADLTPTYSAGNANRFSVRYFLNLVLVDEEDRRYFKQQEIVLWRKDLG
eukprot:CAMPEP_0195510868 /NCGR_PEP_ID=MMETSP0794_2-20130614/3381_1 /TAXON_ID=515487 /ORGANISM="Stephanopyxis turris, Strain CCMP 815" /LENGTH=410 /DNA_ID=CAMNT_0040638375 /DNA_START=136 /DNA_END=1368 /DNA_ORIENTATION=-